MANSAVRGGGQHIISPAPHVNISLVRGLPWCGNSGALRNATFSVWPKTGARSGPHRLDWLTEVR